MKRPELDPLFKGYPRAIGEMPDAFNSHEFILKLAQRNQKAYIEALYAYRKSGDPFRVLHGLLATQLNKHPDLVRQGKRIEDIDIFNRPGRCTTWSKIGK